jgi:hypothetical protein
MGHPQDGTDVRAPLSSDRPAWALATFPDPVLAWAGAAAAPSMLSGAMAATAAAARSQLFGLFMA